MDSTLKVTRMAPYGTAEAGMMISWRPVQILARSCENYRLHQLDAILPGFGSLGVK
jgi:hypothetical protein